MSKRPNTPEHRLMARVQRDEAHARGEAARRIASPEPISPHHYHACHYCTTPSAERGHGLMFSRTTYYRADGELMAKISNVELCTACNGYGYVLTQLGRDYAEAMRTGRLKENSSRRVA